MKSYNLYVIRVTERAHSTPEIYKDIIFQSKDSAKVAFTKLITTNPRASWYRSVRTEIMTLSEFIDKLYEEIDSCPYQE